MFPQSLLFHGPRSFDAKLSINLCALLRCTKKRKREKKGGKKDVARRRAAAGEMNQLSESGVSCLNPFSVRSFEYDTRSGRLTVSQRRRRRRRRGIDVPSAAERCKRHRPDCLAGSIAAAPKRRGVTHTHLNAAGMLI